MAARGRKPLPTALKILEGDRGKGRRPLNRDEPTPPQNILECPPWLMPDAQMEWERLAPSLTAMGILTEHDIEAFAGYCQAYARWREAEEFLSQHGTIFKTPSGYVQHVKGRPGFQVEKQLAPWPPAESGQPVSVNKVLLESDHAHWSTGAHGVAGRA